MSGMALLGAYGADLAFGDPKRMHPVAGFGLLAGRLERTAYAPTRLRGALVAGVLVAWAAGAAQLLARWSSRDLALALAGWASLGGRSLRAEARAVGALLADGELDRARDRLGSLCGRDAGELDEAELSRAVVESLAENTSDAVVGALFWGAVAGPAGVAAYRATNTLDAMFGHRNERYLQFGWAAARLDDLMNWPVARLTALLTGVAAPLLGGSVRVTLDTVRSDGRAHPSPNAGVTEAAFAGALGLRLGGPLKYGRQAEARPFLGSGRPAVPEDIERASRLSFAVATLAALVSAAMAEGRR
ncbi:MAG: adenosylcobinamide-phosphate synthase CbiB [Actinomycetota bacterium]|nr:adenosylcobinamide-phosphate synthase CbiB [Actinomycetota bacterium]